jgi:hypothetical protein
MKISDLLRDFVDTQLLRSIADAVDQQDEIKKPESAPVAVAPGLPVSAAPEEQPTDKFLPPLQLKLELEKRAAGIESIYDEDNDAGDCESEDDAADAVLLQQLKKNAGLKSIMTRFSDDAPLDS